MKRTFKGILYDTEVAHMIGYDSYSCSADPDYWWKESLYRNNTGDFFLYGEGGASSEYSVWIGNDDWRGGYKIIPLSYEQAKEWAKEHLDADIYTLF